MKRALLLNSDWFPLNFISEQRAVRLVLKGRAEVIVNMEGLKSIWGDEFFNSPSLELNVPATLRLLTRVNRSKMRTPRFRKKVLFNRDGWRCQYCDCHLSRETATVDHIIPRSRGGGNSWLNCVTACKSCNKRKADMTPEEANMLLLAPVKKPAAIHFWDSFKSDAHHPDWKMFIKE